jgi:hypothetical protein
MLYFKSSTDILSPTVIIPASHFGGADLIYQNRENSFPDCGFAVVFPRKY